MVKLFMPELIISDFESFTYLFAKYHKLPIISIDNMQVIDRCKLDIAIPNDENINYQIAKNIIKLKVPSCNQYFITSFFYPEINKENTNFIPPILRNEIVNAKTSVKNHILVYQTSTSQDDLISTLQSMPDEQFYVYGFNQDKDCGNVILKKFSETGFVKDLANAKAVLANGGFSLYLKRGKLSHSYARFATIASLDLLRRVFVMCFAIRRVFVITLC